MGWLAFFALLLVAAALLLGLRLPRRYWSLAGAALMLGGTGYALQGSPSLPAAPASPTAAKFPTPPELAQLRGQLFGTLTRQSEYFVVSDALEGAGDTNGAATIMERGVRQFPNDASLWTGLGEAIALHDGGIVSPAAMLAFRRAIALAPQNPGPCFFLGLAYARAGQFADTRREWARALALTPPNAPWRGGIERRLQLLDLLIEAQRRMAERPQ